MTHTERMLDMYDWSTAANMHGRYAPLMSKARRYIREGERGRIEREASKKLKEDSKCPTVPTCGLTNF